MAARRSQKASTRKTVAARTRRGSRVTKEEPTQAVQTQFPTFSRIVKNQTQVSFLLGFLVVAVLSFLLFRYFEKPKDQALITPQASDSQEVAQEATASPLLTTAPQASMEPIQTPQPKAQVTPALTQAPQMATEVKPQAGDYIVKAGDTLWSVAEKQLGSGYKWQEIARVNNLANPSMITEGTRLKLASTEVAQSLQSKSGDVNGQAVTSYTISHGETLWEISQKVYGDPYMWSKIAKANDLENPDLIHAGNVLTIPPKT